MSWSSCAVGPTIGSRITAITTMYVPILMSLVNISSPNNNPKTIMFVNSCEDKKTGPTKLTGPNQGANKWPTADEDSWSIMFNVSAAYRAICDHFRPSFSWESWYASTAVANTSITPPEAARPRQIGTDCSTCTMIVLVKGAQVVKQSLMRKRVNVEMIKQGHWRATIYPNLKVTTVRCGAFWQDNRHCEAAVIVFEAPDGQREVMWLLH